jgi:hypothetical protein
MVVIHRLVIQGGRLDGLAGGRLHGSKPQTPTWRYPGPFVKLPDHSSLMTCSLFSLGFHVELDFHPLHWPKSASINQSCFLRLAPRGAKCRHYDSTLSAWCQDRSEERHPAAFFAIQEAEGVVYE